MDRAAVQFDEVANDRQAKSQPAVLPVDRAVGLSKALEHVGQEVRLDAGPAVRHDDAHALRTGVRKFAIDAASWLGELHRVSEELPHDLLQPLRMAFGPPSGSTQARSEDDPPGPGGWTNRVERGTNDDAEINRAHLESQTSGDDARHIEDVIHESYLQCRIPVDNLERL